MINSPELDASLPPEMHEKALQKCLPTGFLAEGQMRREGSSIHGSRHSWL
jgi:hypothetical protein